ncbi:MAG: hypothetical protein HY906_13125 [Deltaproteobacteria bacterium]|nr:hypothetical protein [Deltaproteobacteria bacterium]
MRALLSLVLAGLCGCGRGGPSAPDGDSAPPAPARPASGLSLTDLRVLDPDGEERMEPRFGRGERLQLALAPHPVAPPLAAVVRIVRADGTLLHQQEPQRVTRGAAVNAAWVVPFALPVTAPSGAYRVEATITDVRGQRGTARARLDHVGADEASASAPASAAAAPAPAASAPAVARRTRPGAGRPSTLAGLRLLDAASLPRTRFARSEQPTLEVEVGGARPGDRLRLRLRGPEGRFEDREGVVPPDATAPGAGATIVRQPVRIPPYGAPGAYRLETILSRGDAAVATRELALTVVAQPLAVPSRLVIEASAVAGQGGRRLAVVEGGRVRVRVRVAGYVVRPEGSASRVAVSATAVLRRPDGHAFSPRLAVGKLEEALPHRPARVDLQGELELPRVPAGDFLLELEVRDTLGAQQASALRHVSLP